MWVKVHGGRGAPSSLLPPTPLKFSVLVLLVQMHSGIACIGCEVSYRTEPLSSWDTYNSTQKLYMLCILQAQMAKHVNLQQ